MFTPEYHFTVNAPKQTVKLKMTRKSKLTVLALSVGPQLALAGAFWLYGTYLESQTPKNYEEHTLTYED